MKGTMTGAAALLLALGACKAGNDLRVEGGDDFSAPSLDHYVAVPDSARWSETNGQLVAVGPADDYLLLNSGVALTDGYIEAESSRADDGGLVLKYTDNGYYVLAFHDDGSPLGGTQNLSIRRVVLGDETPLWSGDVAWPRGTAHTLRFAAQGSTLSVSFDGTLAGQVSDAAAASSTGFVGFRHNGPTASWVSTWNRYLFHVGS